MKSFTLHALVVILVTVSLSVWAQQREPERRDDKYRDDPHAFCYRGPDEGSAHACSCLMVCGPDANGNAVQKETTACAMYCSRQRCTCYADVACDGPEAL